jgi:DNA-directed RNA polymerase alpha subunit
LREAVRDLREEIADGTGRLPFEEGDQAGGTGEAWRDVSVDELNLAGRLAAALVAAGLGTLGGLADYTAAEKRLTDIKGIGQAAAEKIEKKLDQWWEKNPLAKEVAS